MREDKQTVLYWKLWVTEGKTTKDLTQQRDNLHYARRWKLRQPTLVEGKKQLKQAQRQLKETIKKAADHRKEHLILLARMAAAVGKDKDSTIIHRIQRTEENREIFARLRRYNPKHRKSQLTKVLIPQGTTTKSVVDHKEVTQSLLEQNIQHFSQATGAPFTTSLLVDLFGPYGTNQKSDELLKGSFQLHNHQFNETIKVLLQKLGEPTSTTSISTTISGEDVREGYKVWKEHTATSPRGLHLGHAKALLQENEEKSQESQAATL